MRHARMGKVEVSVQLMYFVHILDSIMPSPSTTVMYQYIECEGEDVVGVFAMGTRRPSCNCRS